MSARGKVVLISPVTTWQAYDTWGCCDLYQGSDGSFDTRSRAVSFDRPYAMEDGAGEFLRGQLGVVAEAERLRLPLDYVTDIDLQTIPHLLAGARAVVSMGHDEYWSPRMRAALTAARDAGTNLAFLGANAIFRRIRFGRAHLGPDRLIVNYKAAEEDPLYGHDNAAVTADWPTLPDARPESSLLGAQYACLPTRTKRAWSSTPCGGCSPAAVSARRAPTGLDRHRDRCGAARLSDAPPDSGVAPLADRLPERHSVLCRHHVLHVAQGCRRVRRGHHRLGMRGRTHLSCGRRTDPSSRSSRHRQPAYRFCGGTGGDAAPRPRQSRPAGDRPSLTESEEHAVTRYPVLPSCRQTDTLTCENVAAVPKIGTLDPERVTMTRSRLLAAVAVAVTVATSCALAGCTTSSGRAFSRDTHSAAALSESSFTPAHRRAGKSAEVDPLTGSKPSNDPVIAVRIDDIAGRPQAGVTAADIVYVTQVEGGLTRLLAIFHSTLPTTVEPVRSTRADNPQLALKYGHIDYVASGGSHPELAPLNRSPLRWTSTTAAAPASRVTHVGPRRRTSSRTCRPSQGSSTAPLREASA